ncbi:heavy metal-binding domain-containing protein [Flaviaesturariibacter amylovorans]|uniref:Heavy metal binding domain-containing protein n=1 Tax=Flaviaesturariibacter amylovorans TaxID=1084520 RepID=A0ABP8GCD1_9BACT
MKQITTILLASVLLLAACSDSKTSGTGSSDSTSTAAADGHQHAYRCPMHPEVTGKEGDTCPKCGMKLEHSDAAPDAGGTYFMQFAATPTAIAPGKPVTLSLTPKKKGAESESVALDVEHEKKIHLILVSDDLSWFDHIHPEFAEGGAYTVPATFPAPGKYTAFADYKPSGGGHVVDKIDIDVAGTAPAAKSFSQEKLSGTSGDYSFELQPAGGKLVTGTPLHIAGVVKKGGKEIDANTLDNYLGAKAHFVLISLNEKEYLHVHPEVANGRFDLHTTIEKPGTYRGWVQFNADGTIHTIDFTWNVTKGTGAPAVDAGHGAAGDHSNH